MIAPSEPASVIHNPAVTTHPQPIMAPNAKASTSLFPRIFFNRGSLIFSPPPLKIIHMYNKSLIEQALVHRFSKVKKALLDRKSTRLNSSHVAISYAVFCLKKKKQ